MRILPTGTPFDDAFLFFDAAIPPMYQHLLHDPNYTERFRVVHALCQSSANVLYATAWIEQGNFAWAAAYIDDKACFYAVSRSEHYRLVGARRMVRYSVEAAVDMHILSGHTGPWEPELIELCRETQDVVGNAEGPAPLIILPLLINGAEVVRC
jgi:hypothetical protein